MSVVPTFAVVGRVNKGKSSVLATLAEDDTVRVDRRPGTTQECREFPVRIDDEEVLIIIDTPGFEEAARALAWLTERETSAASRSDLVGQFVRAHAGGDTFAEECKLLQPILDGASILYVVDGTQPYRPNYEAEMEILRWTGQPGMALINRIGDGDHSEDWRRALDQYFKIVRDFDAHSVVFQDRLRLLRSFRELREDWSEPLLRAIQALSDERARRRFETAALMSDYVIAALTHSLEVTVRQRSEIDVTRGDLEHRFHEGLRELERKFRRSVETLYVHHRGDWSSDPLSKPSLDQDLFAEEAWRLLGLTPKQQVAAGALGGAIVGGGIDAAVGGATFLTGTAIGTLVGGGTALYGAMQRLAKARPLDGGIGGLLSDVGRFWSGSKRFRIGPHRGANFPWVVLDRALLHYQAVTRRTHAVRGTVELNAGNSGDGIVGGLKNARRAPLEALFKRIRAKHSDVPGHLREDLYALLRELVSEIDPE